MKKLGVIILNWNGLHLLQKLLPINSSLTVNDEVDLIVVDNGSSDGSVEWIRQHLPEVITIPFDKNYGFAEGYNRAVELLNYPYITLLNSDVEVTEGWFRPILDFLQSNPDVGAVQPKIKSYHHRDSFEYAGAAGGALDILAYPYCRGRLFDVVEKDLGQYDTPPLDVAWASGACLTMTRELYLKLGGLDPRFFAHMEEIDLCMRIHAAGMRVCALTDSAVFHIGGASLKQGDPKKTYLNFRNNLILIHKNMTRSGGHKMLFKRRLADTLAFAMYLLKLDFNNARAIVKAHSDFRKMRKLYTDFPDKDIIPSLPGAKHYAVIARYLLRKKFLPIS